MPIFMQDLDDNHQVVEEEMSFLQAKELVWFTSYGSSEWWSDEYDRPTTSPGLVRQKIQAVVTGRAEEREFMIDGNEYRVSQESFADALVQTINEFEERNPGHRLYDTDVDEGFAQTVLQRACFGEVIFS